jgi:hypothetical protein
MVALLSSWVRRALGMSKKALFQPEVRRKRRNVSEPISKIPRDGNGSDSFRIGEKRAMRGIPDYGDF